jgi:carotenoid cleavage dioxygenase-like enzyme
MFWSNVCSSYSILLLFALSTVPYFPINGFRKTWEKAITTIPHPINHFLRGVFRPVEKESSVNVQHNSSLFQQIQGTTFSQIGSNPRLLVKAKHIGYHWFDGDGMVHVATVKHDSLQYMNRWVKTKRFYAEKKWGQKMYLYFGELRGMHGMMEILKWSFIQLFALIPKAKGTANTAFLSWHDRIYALHESDFPYRIDFQWNDTTSISNTDIVTREQLIIPNVKSVTAHPKIDSTRHHLYLYGYNNQDFLEGRFYHNILDDDFQIIHQSNFSLINNGMIHDIAQSRNHLIIPDLPLKYEFQRILKNKLPLMFDEKNGTTRFATIHKDNATDVQWYSFLEKNIFIFHFIDYAVETDTQFIIYACVMDFLDMEDFVHLENEEKRIRGNLRLQQLVLDKRTHTIQIHTLPEIEKIPELDLNGIAYNMDFPVMSKLYNHGVYCSIFNAHTGKIMGFTYTELDTFGQSPPVTQTQYYALPTNIYANCEPQVITIENKEYLICFTYNDTIERSYLSLIDVHHRDIQSIEIPQVRIPPGFHSLLTHEKQLS